jgi:hypothetical protein
MGMQILSLTKKLCMEGEKKGGEINITGSSRDKPNNVLLLHTHQTNTLFPTS